MGRKNSILCVIGVLVFTSLVQSEDPRGTPGVDYPNYFAIPETSFMCSDQKYNPGFYADLDTKCQAFHFCYQDRMESFLCPTGTIFNQAVLTCDDWYKSNCSLAKMFYSVNAGPVMERAGKNLPMLLRLRNRSQSKSPVQTSTASVLDKIPSVSESETPSETPSISKDKFKIEASDKSFDSSLKDLDNKSDEQMFDSREDLNSASEETEKFTNEVDEEMDTNLVYDGVNDGYYKKYDQYDEWQDTEPGRQFNNFYYGEPHVYESDATKSQLKDSINESFEDYVTIEDSEYPEITKRSSQTARTRLRRKPIYVLEDQPALKDKEMAETSNLDSDISNSALREGKEMNLATGSVDVETPSPTPFPRPTAIPHHMLDISTATPMTSEEFEHAILSELAFPDTTDAHGADEVGAEVFTSSYPQSDQGYSTPFPLQTSIPHNMLDISTATPMTSEEFEHAILSELAFRDTTDAHGADEIGAEVFTSSYPQSEQGYFQSEETYNQSPDFQRDSHYIENGMKPGSYISYDSQYEDILVVPESDEEADIEDTFYVIPDQYDNVGDFEVPGYHEETAYRRQIFADQPPATGYDAYNSYGYSSDVDYPQYYEQANYPEQIAQMYENQMANKRHAYENSYELESQPMNYESSNFDNEETYAQTEFYPYVETLLGVTERPVALPVTEEDLDNFSTDFGEADSEQDMIKLENESGQPEDVYYVFDFDEGQSNQGNETEISKEDEKIKLEESLAKKPEEVNEQSSEVKQLNSSNDKPPVHNESDNEGEVEEFTETDKSAWSSNSLPTSESENIELEHMKSNTDPINKLSGSNLKYTGEHVPLAHESLPSTNSPFSSNMGNFDSSTDSRFLSNMGYSESMDFGPYGFGPNMGQQFSMMESMQSRAKSPFSQRISPAEQPKLSPLSAIQEKMRSMKQGKFGAFKKYMSSTRK